MNYIVEELRALLEELDLTKAGTFWEWEKKREALLKRLEPKPVTVQASANPEAWPLLTRLEIGANSAKSEHLSLSELARRICHAVEQRSDDHNVEMHKRILRELIAWCRENRTTITA